MKRVTKIFNTYIILGIVLMVALSLSSCVLGFGSVYETDDVKDYLSITGNFDNDTPYERMKAFFPEKIQDHFQDVSYYYKAVKGDTFAYEAILEFVIADESDYQTFTKAYRQDPACVQFPYDNSYSAVFVSNIFWLNNASVDLYPKNNHIGVADVGLILFRDSDQRLVFVSLGVHDGGIVTIEELGRFFERFSIDPYEFDRESDYLGVNSTPQ